MEETHHDEPVVDTEIRNDVVLGEGSSSDLELDGVEETRDGDQGGVGDQNLLAVALVEDQGRRVEV